MSWGWVMTIIAAVGLVMLVGFAIWYWQLLGNIWFELRQLGKRAEQISNELGRLDLAPLDRAQELRARAEDLEVEPDLDRRDDATREADRADRAGDADGDAEGGHDRDADTEAEAPGEQDRGGRRARRARIDAG